MSIEALRTSLQALGASLSETSLQAFMQDARSQTLAVGSALLEPGDAPGIVGLVLSGAMRELFILADGTEKTCGFAFEGDLVGSYADALQNRSSGRRVEAIEPTTLLVLSVDVIRRAGEQFEDANRLLRHISERLYVRKAQREYELLTMDAMQRYLLLLEKHPQIEQRVSQQHLASYLGMTPVHLSRLRARRRRQPGTRSPPRS